MSKPEVVLQSLKNTRMCKFAETGRCRRGQACNFAHSEADLRPQPDLYSTRLCAQFSAGGCRYGRRCRFAHGEAELRPVINESVPEPGPNQKGRSRGRQSQGYQANAAPVLNEGDSREMRPAVRGGPNLGPCHQGLHLQGPAGWPEMVQEVPQLVPPVMLASSSQTIVLDEDRTRRRPQRAPRLSTETTYNAQPSISELHPAVYPFARASTEGVPADRGDSRVPGLAARLAAHGLPGSPGKGQHADRLFLDDPVSGGALWYRTETEEPTSCGTLASRTTTMQTESEAPAPPTSFWL